ncbi:hypothetical protein [Bacillus sp. OV166]|uniref:hypothetical protein n=1 Tax=Bacillus sp. OV166 TaxID=1882763 RepID=UPI000B4426C0|nr:hypothetical protein [Bacillus sp. OV166]
MVVGKAASNDPNLNKSTKPELYNVYSLDIKNIGDKDNKMVRVEAYRDEPNSTTQFELFTVDYEHDNLNPSFQHQNFPLYTKATELKVIVTWTKKSEKMTIHESTGNNLFFNNKSVSRRDFSLLFCCKFLFKCKINEIFLIELMIAVSKTTKKDSPQRSPSFTLGPVR